MRDPGPLALVGGDELKAGNEPQDEVLVEAAGGGPAFVLATAAGPQGAAAAVANARDWFGRLGLRVEELPAVGRLDVMSPEHAERARSGRFFYLVGGDPGIVPATLSGSPLWSSIVAAWREGAALAGSSAGAMALGEWSLVRERYPGDRRRRYAPGLRLVPRTAVVPHFDTFGGGWVDAALGTLPADDVVLLGVDERAAALWRGGTWWAMGGGVTVIANGERRRFAAGSRVDALPRPAGDRG